MNTIPTTVRNELSAALDHAHDQGHQLARLQVAVLLQRLAASLCAKGVEYPAETVARLIHTVGSVVANSPLGADVSKIAIEDDAKPL